MPWWGWVILGLILLGSELLIIDAAFYLVFVGFAAIATGMIVLAGPGIEVAVQWLIFAGIAAVTMVLFRKRLYDMIRGNAEDYGDGIVGDVLTLSASLEAGDSCRMRYRGTNWTVRNDGQSAIPESAHVTIQSVEGLTLVVHEKRSDPAQ